MQMNLRCRMRSGLLKASLPLFRDAMFRGERRRQTRNIGFGAGGLYPVLFTSSTLRGLSFGVQNWL